MTRALAALGVGLVLLVAVGTRSEAKADGSSATARCAAGSTPAVVGQRRVCLRYAASCRQRYQQQYRRYGFVCLSGYLDYYWKPLRRPLHIPTLAPGSSCPATISSGTIGQRGSVDLPAAPAFGPGPAFPMGLSAASGGATLVLTWTPTDDDAYAGWWGTKVLWTTPRYVGAVLIRGGQLDGTNALGFDIGPQWTRSVLSALRFVGPEVGLHPAATFVRAPGCYAYQVDICGRAI